MRVPDERSNRALRLPYWDGGATHQLGIPSLPQPLATSIVPAISHAFAKRDHQGIYDRNFVGSMRLTFMATVPFTVLLYIIAAPTVNWILLMRLRQN